MKLESLQITILVVGFLSFVEEGLSKMLTNLLGRELSKLYNRGRTRGLKSDYSWIKTFRRWF